MNKLYSAVSGRVDGAEIHGDECLAMIYGYQEGRFGANGTPDGIYLRFARHNDEYYTIQAEAHITNAKNGDMNNNAYMYCEVETFKGEAIAPIVGFFDDCAWVKPWTNGINVFQMQNLVQILDFARQFSRNVVANNECWYLSCTSSEETRNLLKAGMELTKFSGVMFSIHQYQTEAEPETMTIFFAEANFMENYMTIRKIGPDKFLMTAYHETYHGGNKIDNFFVDENSAHKIVRSENIPHMIFDIIKRNHEVGNA